MAESDLEKLDSLHAQGVLSEQAYWEARSRLYVPAPLTADPAGIAQDGISGTPANVEFAVPPADQLFSHSEPARRTARPRRRWLLISVALLVAAAIGVGGYVIWKSKHPDTEKQYLSALRKAGLLKQYGSSDAAVTRARRECDQFGAGHVPMGYRADRVAVQYYCKQYLSGFKIIPTPAEQLAAYKKDLTANGVGEKFSSDAEAEAHAKSVCGRLRGGGAPQGSLADSLGVKTYCHQFFDGFKILRTVTVRGTFTLIDSDPSSYYPSITAYGRACEGSNGYSDIGMGTSVVVTNDSGRTLAHASLGLGTGSETRCVFHFRFRVTEGQDNYSVAVSHRGKIDYSFDQFESDEVALTLGS